MKQIDKREALLILTLIGLVCFSTTTAVAVHAPVLNDHTVHLAKLALLKEQVLTDHRWWGWTHKLLFGYPLNYTYPYLGYILVLVIDFLSGPLLSLDGAYLVFLNLVSSSLLLAVYLWSRRASGKAAAFFASLLIILDKGGPHYGGYEWFSVIGVWACELSLALFLIFLFFQTSALNAKGLSSSVLAGLFLGFSLLAHPVAGVALLPALLAYAVSLLGTEHLGKGKYKTLKRVGLSLTIGLTMSAVWVLPYLSVNSYALPFRKEWHTLTKIITIMAAGKFAYLSPSLLILGLLGFMFCLSRKEPCLQFIALFPLFTIVFGSSTFINATGLNHIFKNFEMVRLQIFIRPFFAIAAGTMSWVIFDKLLKNQDPNEKQSPFAGRPLLKMATATIILGLAIVYWQQMVQLRGQWNSANRPAYSLKTQATLIHELKWLLAKEGGFVRVHFAQPEQRPRTYMDLCRRLNVPVSFEPFYPVTNVRYGNSRGQERSRAVSYGVRLLVTGEKALQQEGWELVAEIEPWFVYRYDRPEQIVQTFGARSKIQDLQIQSNEIRFKVSDIEDLQVKNDLRVFMSPFPRWQLSINGTPRAWELVEKEGFPDGFFSLPLEDGEYILSFRTGAPEKYGAMITLLSILLALVLLVKEMKKS